MVYGIDKESLKTLLVGLLVQNLPKKGSNPCNLVFPDKELRDKFYAAFVVCFGSQEVRDDPNGYLRVDIVRRIAKAKEFDDHLRVNPYYNEQNNTVIGLNVKDVAAISGRHDQPRGIRVVTIDVTKQVIGNFFPHLLEKQQELEEADIAGKRPVEAIVLEHAPKFVGKVIERGKRSKTEYSPTVCFVDQVAKSDGVGLYK